MMHPLSALLLGAGATVFAAPASTLDDRASSCTFTTAASAIAGKGSCSTITLNNIAVPAGTTLDLTKLNSGTTVRPVRPTRNILLTAIGHLSRNNFFRIQRVVRSPDLGFRNQNHSHRCHWPRH